MNKIYKEENRKNLSKKKVLAFFACFLLTFADWSCFCLITIVAGVAILGLTISMAISTVILIEIKIAMSICGLFLW